MNAPPPWLVRVVVQVTGVLAKLRRRLLPPHAAATELGTMSWVAQSIAAFCALGLAEALAQGARTPKDLAAQGYGDQTKLFRLLRALAAYDVVRYAGHDRFALGHVGKGLTGTHSAGPLVLYANASWHIQGYTHLAASMQGGRSGFELGHDASLFEYFRTNDEAATLFDAAMQSLTALFALPFAQAYDFSPMTQVVDVGGGTGVLLATVLKRFPRVYGTVFELPSVAHRARELARTQGLSDQLTSVEGNIFIDVPPSADAYILSHVLHDWDDDSCASILQNVRRAMPVTARVLVYEVVAKPPNNSWSQDRIQDLEMLAMLPGRERTLEEYNALFARSELRLSRVIPTAAAESIIEAIPLDTSGPFVGPQD